jgi:hypothetical protein
MDVETNRSRYSYTPLIRQTLFPHSPTILSAMLKFVDIVYGMLPGTIDYRIPT